MCSNIHILRIFALGYLVAAQQITDITQVPAYTALASCPAKIVSAVIDDSTSPICPAGSPPKCFCDNEVNSSEWEAQISTNVLNNCPTSARAAATQAAAVFASYCSLALAVATTSNAPLSTTQSTAAVMSVASSTTPPTSVATSISTPQAEPSSTSTSVFSSTSSPAQTSSPPGSSAITTVGNQGSSNHKLALELGVGIGVGVPVAFVIGLILCFCSGKYCGSSGSADLRRMRKANKYMRRKPGAMDAINRL